MCVCKYIYIYMTHISKMNECLHQMRLTKSDDIYFLNDHKTDCNKIGMGMSVNIY